MAGQTFNTSMLDPATRRAMEDITRRLGVQEANIIDGTITAGGLVADNLLINDPVSGTRRLEFGDAPADSQLGDQAAILFYARDGDDDFMNISWEHGVPTGQTLSIGQARSAPGEHMTAGIKIETTLDDSINSVTLKGDHGSTQITAKVGSAQMSYFDAAWGTPNVVQVADTYITTALRTASLIVRNHASTFALGDGTIEARGKILGTVGSVGRPSYSWLADEDTGTYLLTYGVIGFATNGRKTMTVSDTSTEFFSWNGTNVATMDCSGGQGWLKLWNDTRATWSDYYLDTTWNRIHSSVPTYFNNWIAPTGIKNYTGGTVTAPAYSFQNDQDTGLYRTTAGRISVALNGVESISFTDYGLSIMGPDRGSSNKSWSSMQLRVFSRSNTGGEATNSIVGMSFWNQLYGTAPIMRVYGPYGEAMGFTNNANTAYAPIVASAFTVSSTQRAKKDLEVVEDDRVIDLASKWLMAEFTDKVRPQTLRKNDRFKDVDRRWQAQGRSPLTPNQDRDLETMDHSCVGEDSLCDGTADAPCPITANDTRRFGGLAEWWGEVAPEQTMFDEEGIALGINVDQVASTALGAVGALTRRLQDALDRIDILEGKTPAVRAKGAWVK